MAPREAWRVVLIEERIEDRVQTRRTLLQGAERRYTVVEAASAAAGLSAVLDPERGPPDCVLLDYDLPDADALDLLEALARPGGGFVCPVVVLTGDAGQETTAAALRAGAHDFLGKAWMTPASLTRTMENAAERFVLARELRERDAALRDADWRKDELLAVLAHELRNPLAPIRTGLEVMKLSPPGSPAAAKAQEVIERQLGHLVRLVDDLLDVSRISRGKVELGREQVEVAAIVEQALEASRPLVEAGGHQLAVAVPTDPIWITGDLTRLAQVVSNLLNNAAKYTPRGGHIHLSAAAAGGQCILRVVDDGVGISAEMLPRVFDLFTQVDGTLDRAQGGLGIGLALVRKLVEMHGGRVWAESPGLGRGSTFSVSLPLSCAGDHQEDRPADGRRRVAEVSGRRILVVDDNEDAAEALATLLSLAGHQTRTAADGPSALDVARAFSPEVVFLDIGLPGMDGYEVARQMRADPALSHATLVALTGWGSEADRRRTEEAGFDVRLTKPAEVTEVNEVLDRVGGAGRS
jgi:signal transduction histidine kinase